MTTESEIRERLDALAAQFIKDAKAIDPSIIDAWGGYDVSESPHQRLHHIYLGRAKTPFVRRTKGGAA